MRIRSSYVIAGILLLIGGFFLVAWIRTSGATRLDADTDAEFLKEVSELRESGGGSASHDGLLAAASTNTSSGPRIELETDHYYMGEIDNTKPTTKQMPIYNRGDAPLEIIVIRTSCACTVGEMTKNSTNSKGEPATIIPPGGELPLSITVDPYRIPAFHSSKVLTVTSNDPLNPAVELPVDADVLPEFTLEPDSLDLGTIQNGQQQEATIILRQANAGDLDVTSIQPGRNATRKTNPDQNDVNSGDLQYSLALRERPKSEWKSPDKKEWEIDVEFASDLPVGSFNDSFFILTNNKRVDSVPYKVSAQVESFFSVTPTMLSVRNAVEPGSSLIATAVVSADTDFSVDDVEVTGEAFSVAVRDGDKPHTKFVDLGVRPDAGPGLKNESVSFTVRSGDKTVKHTMRAFASVTG